MADIVAWGIAIEKYAGSELNINDPVGGWALQFAETMLGRGATKVVLSVSLEFDYKAKLEQLRNKGVILLGATQSELQDALAEIEGGDALFIYVIGHGIKAPARQLLCADSERVATLRTIDIDSLLTRLRSPEFARLQIGFIDCCAQLISHPPAALRLNGTGETETDQYFYYSASAGDTSAATTAAEGFSTVVLKSLQQTKQFPPNLDEFFASLRASLNTLNGASRPFLLQFTDRSGDQWSSTAGVAADELDSAADIAGLRRSQFDRLWIHAFRAGRPAVDLANAVAANQLDEFIADFKAAQPTATAPVQLERAREQLELQQQYNGLCLNLRLSWREWRGLYNRLARERNLTLRPAYDLSALLLNILDQPDEQKRHRDFVTALSRAARRAGTDAGTELLNAVAADPDLRPYTKDATSPADEETFLMLDIDWEPGARMPSLIKAWIYPGLDGKCHAREVRPGTSLAEQINAVVQKALEEFPERTFTLELLAPNELLSMPEEFLRMVDADLEICTWLEENYPVAVRWKARLQDRNNRYRGNWMRQSYIAETRTTQPPLTCQWRPIEVGVGDHHVIALTFPGPSLSDPARNKAMFFTELARGEPYMCWPRNLVDAQQLIGALANVLAQAGLNGLASAIRDRRSDPVIKDLIVFIDLPKRNPYDMQTALTEVAQGGTNE